MIILGDNQDLQEMQPGMAPTLLVYLPPPLAQPHKGPSVPSPLLWAQGATTGADFLSGSLLRFSQDAQCPRLPEEAPWGLAQAQPHAAVGGGLRSLEKARSLRGQSVP